MTAWRYANDADDACRASEPAERGSSYEGGSSVRRLVGSRRSSSAWGARGTISLRGANVGGSRRAGRTVLMRKLLLPVLASLFLSPLAIGCSAPSQESPEGDLASAQSTGELETCAPLVLGSASVSLATTREGTTSLRFAWPRKDVGDPMFASSMTEESEIVFATKDLASVKRVIAGNGRLLAAAFGATPGVDAQADAYRDRLAQLYVDNLRCTKVASPPVEAGAPAPAAPAFVCASPRVAAKPFLGITRGPDVTPAPTTPERRASFAAVFELPPSEVPAASPQAATLHKRRVLTMERLGADVQEARDLLRLEPPFRTSLAALLVGGHVRSFQEYLDLDASLSCE